MTTIITLDADDRIRSVNPAFEGRFGSPLGSSSVKGLTSFMPVRFREGTWRGSTVLRTGEPSVRWSDVAFPGSDEDGWEIQLSISYGEDARNGEHGYIGIPGERTA